MAKPPFRAAVADNGADARAGDDVALRRKALQRRDCHDAAYTQHRREVAGGRKGVARRVVAVDNGRAKAVRHLRGEGAGIGAVDCEGQFFLRLRNRQVFAKVDKPGLNGLYVCVLDVFDKLAYLIGYGFSGGVSGGWVVFSR